MKAAKTPAGLTLAPLPKGRTFLIVGEGCWGKHHDFQTALQITRKHYGRALKLYIVFDAPADAQIDSGGGIRWTPSIPPEITDEDEQWKIHDQQAPREIARKGFHTPFQENTR